VTTPGLNYMVINTKKTKKMLIGSIQKNLPPLLQLDEHVTNYNLLGLHVTDSLQGNERDCHHCVPAQRSASLCSRAAQRLHFLQQLKLAVMSSDDLLYYYQTVVRPVTENAYVVWHTSLTQDQTKQLESIQKLAMKIIFGTNSGDLLITVTNVSSSLAERCEWLTKWFFSDMSNKTNCLHELLPAKRDRDVTVLSSN